METSISSQGVARTVIDLITRSCADQKGMLFLKLLLFESSHLIFEHFALCRSLTLMLESFELDPLD